MPADPRTTVAVATIVLALLPSGSGCSSSAEPERQATMAVLGLDARPVNETCVGSVEPPEVLSRHPCIDPATLRPTSSLVPYGVRAPLWSDGADKNRYIALPEGASFAVSERGGWELPPGGVLVKEFELGGRRLETRFVTRDASGTYRFYTYAFLDGQHDARLLTDGAEIPLESSTWTVPSEAQCDQCHNRAAGRVLGLQTGQLDRPWTYSSTGREADQLETLKAIGFVKGLEPAPLVFPDLEDETVPVEARARAYLHVNCSTCHRPRGVATSIMDLRSHVDVRGMGVCMTYPMFSDPTGADGRLLVPGEPDRSILFHRATTVDPLLRMPPVGRATIDPLGAQLLRRWIEEMPACN